MPAIGVIGVFFAFGLFQLFAVLAALESWFDLHWLAQALIGILACYTPLLGTALGIIGAVEGWDWSWPQSIGVFTAPFLIYLTHGLGLRHRTTGWLPVWSETSPSRS